MSIMIFSLSRQNIILNLLKSSYDFIDFALYLKSIFQEHRHHCSIDRLMKRIDYCSIRSFLGCNIRWSLQKSSLRRVQCASSRCHLSQNQEKWVILIKDCN